MKWKEGKRVKKCPRCQIFTEKNEGCNHMTCVNCKYQLCWLCEGPYKYGHYDSGKCAGHQFTRADNLDEIPKRNNSFAIDHGENTSYFGLHSLFPCYYESIPNYYRSNILEENFFLRYVIMFLLWILGVLVIFCVKAFDYMEDKIIFEYDETQYIEYFLFIFTGLSLMVAYQILFICILAPFILISFFNHKFFNKVQLFFELS